MEDMDTAASAMETKTNTIVCYAPTMITTNGIWQGDNPLDYSLPLFILQLMMVVVLTRILVFILKPLRQPRVVAEILAGVILGPSALGRIESFGVTVFPLRSVMVLETMANIGLLYFLFLVGVEMDIEVIRRSGRKALAIALGGMILPFAIGIGFSFILNKPDEIGNRGTFILFLSVALSVTAFPVLARILAELKLLNSELGRIAMASALVNDICAWVLLAIAIALTEKDPSLSSLWVLLSSSAFVLFCVFVVRPGINWITRRTPEGEPVSEFYVCLILTGVMISGFITDALGTRSVFGAFVFGLIIPNGHLGVILMEKLEDFVSGLLLPLFFAISGLRTDVYAIKGAGTWLILFLIILLSFAGKVAGTVLVALFNRIPLREGVTLGLLMNTKGLVEIIVLNVGRDQKILDEAAFAMLVITAICMTGIIMPVITAIYKPARRYVPYKRRTVMESKTDAEMRLLVCVHTPRNVPTLINLLEASNATKRSPICVYVLHLVELTGRASAMLIVHSTRKSGRPAANRTQAQSDHIINAFENYEQHAGNVSVQPLTAISPYSTMHVDICNLAEDKRVAFIIIPFHKQQTVDGAMEATNPAFRTVNQNVLANAPCSVGILVDRGLAGSTRMAANQTAHHVAVLFFGGPDDREAMCYAWRMVEHPGTNLTVIRFLPGEEALEDAETPTHQPSDPGMLTVETDANREKLLDDNFLSDFRTKTSGKSSIMYSERIVNNGEETVAAIRAMDNANDLFIVGRGQSMISPLTAGLTDWSECPELGAIGDLLASSDAAATVSVLVVQQYIGNGPQTGGGILDSPGNQESHYNNFHDTSRRTPSPRYGP